MQKSASVAFSFLIGETAMSECASASYSAYTRREEDWKTREKNGGESGFTESVNLIFSSFLIKLRNSGNKIHPTIRSSKHILKTQKSNIPMLENYDPNYVKSLL